MILLKAYLNVLECTNIQTRIKDTEYIYFKVKSIPLLISILCVTVFFKYALF